MKILTRVYSHDRGIRHSHLARKGVTWIEVLVILGVIGLLVGLLLPSVRTSRGAARRMSCSNNFKQLGLAIHNYHAAYQVLPSAMGGTGHGATPKLGNANRLSGLVGLLPFLEQESLWDQIKTSGRYNEIDFPPMGPTPWTGTYDPWRTKVMGIRCPSDPGQSVDFGRTNYAFVIGDSPYAIHRPAVARGMFACRTVTRFADVTDGLSQTLAMAEIATPADPTSRQISSSVVSITPAELMSDRATLVEWQDPRRPGVFADSARLRRYERGTRWADGAATFSLANTILPPNSGSFAVGAAALADGFYTASSYHHGGCHVLMGDGAVKFATNSIEAGISTAIPLSADAADFRFAPSPHGLWGSLGTAAGHEEIDGAGEL